MTPGAPFNPYTLEPQVHLGLVLLAPEEVGVLQDELQIRGVWSDREDHLSWPRNSGVDLLQEDILVLGYVAEVCRVGVGCPARAIQ